MTISTRTLGCLFSAAAFGLFIPATAWAAPDEAPKAGADADADDDLDLEADLEANALEANADDVSEDDKDIDIDIGDNDDDDKGCTIATDNSRNLGGLLCTLGLLGWQLRRRRPK